MWVDDFTIKTQIRNLVHYLEKKVESGWGDDMKKYLVFIERKESFAGESIPEHRTFVQDLRERDVLVSAGAFTDQSGLSLCRSSG